jgi:hypothetical protein
LATQEDTKKMRVEQNESITQALAEAK